MPLHLLSFPGADPVAAVPLLPRAVATSKRRAVNVSRPSFVKTDQAKVVLRNLRLRYKKTCRVKALAILKYIDLVDDDMKNDWGPLIPTDETSEDWRFEVVHDMFSDRRNPSYRGSQFKSDDAWVIGMYKKNTEFEDIIFEFLIAFINKFATFILLFRI